MNSKTLKILTNEEYCAKEIPEETIELYHYTSAQTFLNIMASRSVRFTDIRFLNDKQENEVFNEALQDFLNARKGITKYPAFFEVLDAYLHSSDPFNVPEERVFVFCGSLDPDSLTMWKYYVKNSKYQGYSISYQFKNTDLAKMIFQPKFGTKTTPASFFAYGPITYADKGVTQKLIQTWAECMTTFGFYKSKMYACLKRYAKINGIFTKNQKFEDEKEFRIAIGFKESAMLCNSIDFMEREGVMTPYYTLNYEGIGHVCNRIFIAPMTEKDISIIGAKNMLEKYNYTDVEVICSTIPVRF